MSSKIKKSKTDRLITALSKGRKLSTEQAIKEFAFSSQGSLSAAVTSLRNEGYDIRCIAKDGGPARKSNPGRYELRA